MTNSTDQEREAFDLAYQSAIDNGWTSTKDLARYMWGHARAKQPAGGAVPDDWQETVNMAIDLIQDLRQGTAVERRLRALLAAPHPVTGEQESEK